MPLATAILGDLDSVLLGIGGRVSNLRFAAVEAAVLALGEQVKEGRHLSAEALDSLTLGEDRMLVVEINHISAEIPPTRTAVADANVVDILGGDPARVAALRRSGLPYGDAAISLCESEETGWTSALVEAHYAQMRAAARAVTNEYPPGRVDAALAAGGSSAPIEIMLNQVARALREEMSCG